MGNSEHGCVCMKSQERVRARNIWKHSYLSSLELLYQKGNKWAESLCAIILIWDSNLDNAFKNSNRWQFFLSRECEKSALEYHAYPAHAPFGGYKKSGFGRETHKMMLNHYRNNKNMLISYDQNKLGFF